MGSRPSSLPTSERPHGPSRLPTSERQHAAAGRLIDRRRAHAVCCRQAGGPAQQRGGERSGRSRGSRLLSSEGQQEAGWLAGWAQLLAQHRACSETAADRYSRRSRRTRGRLSGKARVVVHMKRRWKARTNPSGVEGAPLEGSTCGHTGVAECACAGGEGYSPPL